MSDPQWLTAAEQQIWRTYLLAAAELAERMDIALRPYGLSLTEYSIMVHLAESPNGQLRMSELADAVHQSRSRLTHTINRMEQAGRVRRRTSGADRRGVWAELTEDGRALMVEAAPAHVASVRRHFVDAACPEDFAALGRVFNALMDLPRDDGTLAPRRFHHVAPAPTAEPDPGKTEG